MTFTFLHIRPRLFCFLNISQMFWDNFCHPLHQSVLVSLVTLQSCAVQAVRCALAAEPELSVPSVTVSTGT